MILLCCDWQNVINAIPCLCWGLLIVVGLLVGLHLYFKYVIQPKNRHLFEEESKQYAFAREILWDERKEEKNKKDEEVNSEASLKKENEELKKKEEEMKNNLAEMRSRQEALNKLLDLYKQHLNSIISNTKKQ